MRGRRPARLLLVLVGLAVLLLGPAGPASAHATLVSSDPVEGAVLDAAPDRIRLTFDEAVAAVPDGAQVFDAEGAPVAASAAATGKELTVSLPERVGPGTYVVVWRVVSEDGHPVSGSLTFSVGAPSVDVTPPPSGSTSTTAAPLALSVSRWLGYAGLLLSTGLVAFCLLVVPADQLTGPVRHRLVAVARIAAGATVVAWLVGLPLTVMYQLGADVGSLTSGATWAGVSTAEYVVTAAVVLGTAAAVGLLGRGTSTGPRRFASLTAGAVAVVAPAFLGHTRAATPEVLVVGADMLHLLAGSIWLGGLVGLALTLRDLADRPDAAAVVLARFSGIAAGVLGALVAAGTVLAWRIVGSWDALVSTGYGRLLLVKVAFALVAVAIAGWNRYRLVPALRASNRQRTRRAGADLVRRAVVAEASVLVVVLAVTGFLVDRSPQAEVSAVSRERNSVQTATLGDVAVLARLAPLTPGPNAVTLELTDSSGAPFEGYEAPRARLASDDVDLGPVELTNVGPGSYAADVVVPSPGTWRLQVSLRTSEFDNPVTTVEFQVDAP
ncbi:copper resistance CopC/CopD family protein [Cellulomonas terrae]|uniref:Transport integral membrane protein n=1 Tax=Cellulomonas terrae TaxID=311234 RepID=A0A511JQX9_9CELL|nr:copper resistance protein CopC [Cellulomonas terrae]GEM00335.1 transport integral membrane protein [Cellulomonas terrae]